MSSSACPKAYLDVLARGIIRGLTGASNDADANCGVTTTSSLPSLQFPGGRDGGLDF